MQENTIKKELQVVNLQKKYKSKPIVKNVSLIVQKEIVGLLGPNGAGKSTSFYMIVGLLKPDKGHVYLNGKDLSKLPIHKRARLGLGYLPQETSTFRKLSVYENLLAILELRKDLTKQEKKAKLETLLEEFHIQHLRNVLGIRLSGGEKRRLEIARALAMDPDFILLDEPFAGIDPISVMDIKRIILHLKERGIGVLITDHNVRETLDICERAYIVNEGEIIASGTPEAILKDAQVRKAYLGEHFYL